jgi:predicted ATPase
MEKEKEYVVKKDYLHLKKDDAVFTGGLGYLLLANKSIGEKLWARRGGRGDFDTIFKIFLENMIDMGIIEEKPLKVKKYVLTGGPCSGKSSVIDKLRLRGYRVVGEVARAVIADRGRYPCTNRENALRQREIFDRQILLEKDLHNNFTPQAFLDRGIIDCKVYTEKFNKDYTGIEDLKIDFSGHDLGKRYSRVFLLDLVPHKSDDIRTESEQEALEMHERIAQAYREYGYNLINVPQFDLPVVEAVRKRADFILNYLRENDK